MNYVLKKVFMYLICSFCVVFIICPHFYFYWIIFEKSALSPGKLF